MKYKILFFIICTALICMLCSSCNIENSFNTNYLSDTNNDNNNGLSNDDYAKVIPLGDVPNEFNKIIDNNVFQNVKAINDNLIKCYYDYTTSIYTIKLLNNYGEILAQYDRILPLALNNCSLCSTVDGGYIASFGFSDYEISDDVWASESGVYSLILKFDTNGNLEWETKLDNYTSSMLKYCIELDNGYYFFGDQETPETKIKGVVSPGDVHIASLDKSGNLINSIAYKGSDYDWVTYVEEKGDNFVIYGSSQSSNGIFSSLKNKTGYPISFELIVDANFQIISINKFNYNDIPSKEFIGRKDDEKIYTDDILISDYNAGTVKLIIDYNDFYLIVSENIIGIDNSLPFLSSVRYLTETVYSAYDDDNNLIWRTTIDTEPFNHDIIYLQ